MPWDRSAKLKFYHARRSQYIKTLKSLGLSPKEAVKVANRELGKEYNIRKEGYKKINRIEKEIKQRQAKGLKTKRLERQLQNQLQKTANRWAKFESAIGYKDPAEIEEKKLKY